MTGNSTNNAGGKPTAQATPPGAKPGGSIFDAKPAPEGAAKTMSSVLGEIVWLMSQSPLHKQFFISDLEWFVMAPSLLQQFRLFYADDRPVGVILWADVSAEVEQTLANGVTRLRPQDWKSGDRLWIVEVIAPFGGHDAMLADIKEKVFPTRQMRYLVANEGRREVRVV